MVGRIMKKWDGEAWTRLLWPRIQTGGVRLLMRWLSDWFHKMRGISWLAEVLLASKEGLYSVEFIVRPRALKLHVGPNFNIRLYECDTFETLPWKNQWNFVFANIYTSSIKPLFVNKHLCVPTFIYITGYHTVDYISFASSCTCVHWNVQNVLRIPQRRSLSISGKIFDLYNRWNAFVCRVLLTSKLVCAYYSVPIPVAARSKMWVCDRLRAGIVVSNPTGSMYVCCECCVLSRRRLCVGLVTRPE